MVKRQPYVHSFLPGNGKSLNVIALIYSLVRYVPILSFTINIIIDMHSKVHLIKTNRLQIGAPKWLS